jgi:hypothetical protein
MINTMLVTIFEDKLKDPSSCRKLMDLSMSYIKNRLEKRDFRFEPKSHIVDHCIAKLLVKFTPEDFPEIHELFRMWQPNFRLEEEESYKEFFCAI